MSYIIHIVAHTDKVIVKYSKCIVTPSPSWILLSSEGETDNSRSDGWGHVHACVWCFHSSKQKKCSTRILYWNDKAIHLSKLTQGHSFYYYNIIVILELLLDLVCTNTGQKSRTNNKTYALANIISYKNSTKINNI